MLQETSISDDACKIKQHKMIPIVRHVFFNRSQ